MAVAPYTGSGSVPVRETHPVLDGGSLIGHGGAALKVFVGLSVQQNQQLEHMGQLEAPRGRRGEFYWPLKSQAETALESGANRASGSGRAQDVVLRPLTVTYVGLREMLQNGTLYACDGERGDCTRHCAFRRLATRPEMHFTKCTKPMFFRFVAACECGLVPQPVFFAHYFHQCCVASRMDLVLKPLFQEKENLIHNFEQTYPQ